MKSKSSSLYSKFSSEGAFWGTISVLVLIVIAGFFMMVLRSNVSLACDRWVCIPPDRAIRMVHEAIRLNNQASKTNSTRTKLVMLAQAEANLKSALELTGDEAYISAKSGVRVHTLKKQVENKVTEFLAEHEN